MTKFWQSQIMSNMQKNDIMALRVAAPLVYGRALKMSHLVALETDFVDQFETFQNIHYVENDDELHFDHNEASKNLSTIGDSISDADGMHAVSDALLLLEQ